MPSCLYKVVVIVHIYIYLYNKTISIVFYSLLVQLNVVLVGQIKPDIHLYIIVSSLITYLFEINF